MRVLLKKEYGTKIWDDKKQTKPYIQTALLKKELKTTTWFHTKTAQQIMDVIKMKNENYFKTLTVQEQLEVNQNGGFCLQYKDPKARWVKTLF